MLHSTVTKKGQTTIPGQVRKAMNIKPGDKLEYALEADYVTFRVHPGARALRGALASDKGKTVPFSRIRETAAKVAMRYRRGK